MCRIICMGSYSSFFEAFSQLTIYHFFLLTRENDETHSIVSMELCIWWKLIYEDLMHAVSFPWLFDGSFLYGDASHSILCELEAHLCTLFFFTFSFFMFKKTCSLNLLFQSTPISSLLLISFLFVWFIILRSEGKDCYL